MNALDQLIDQLITESGPISLATYINLCLNHPQYGYYSQADALGKDGDFVTAPDISQLFGEMIGVWCLHVFDRFGQPDHIDIVELGPGRGTLMADILRTINVLPSCDEAINVTLVETNHTLVKKQKSSLEGEISRINWISELSEFERKDGAPLIILANEFFDALPIRQFQYSNAQWHERLVGLTDGQKSFGLAPAPVVPNITELEHQKTPQDNAILETSPARIGFMDQLCELMATGPSAALIIDYGYEKPQFGETFQALAAHQFVDPLQNCGNVDLTSHVCFAPLLDHAQQQGLTVGPLISQGQFLSAMGIERRYDQLVEQNADLEEELGEGVIRLMDPKQMGELFKVMFVGKMDLLPYPFHLDAFKGQ